MEKFKLRGTNSAKVIPVIQTISVIGEGTDDNPCRQLIQYWDLDGKLLAKVDTLKHLISEHAD